MQFTIEFSLSVRSNLQYVCTSTSNQDTLVTQEAGCWRWRLETSKLCHWLLLVSVAKQTHSWVRVSWLFKTTILHLMELDVVRTLWTNGDRGCDYCCLWQFMHKSLHIVVKCLQSIGKGTVYNTMMGTSHFCSGTCRRGIPVGLLELKNSMKYMSLWGGIVWMELSVYVHPFPPEIRNLRPLPVDMCTWSFFRASLLHRATMLKHRFCFWVWMRLLRNTKICRSVPLWFSWVDLLLHPMYCQTRLMVSAPLVVFASPMSITVLPSLSCQLANF